METVSLENSKMSVSLVPDFGARIVALCDKRTGRDWIAAGASFGSAADDAGYGAREATGWDECFPTVGQCVASGGGAQRDHGDLWGRPWTVTKASRTMLAAHFARPDYRFARTLLLAGGGLDCQYQVDNISNAPLSYLWAMHALFSLTPGDRIDLPAGTPCQTTYRSDGQAASTVAWPDGAAFPLSLVQPVERAFAAKLLIDRGPEQGIRIGDTTGSLLITAERQLSGSVGLWLCYGGWLSCQSVHQVAIEPTSAPADDLAAAEAMGRAVTIPPGRSATWWTKLALGPGLDAPPSRTFLTGRAS